MIVLGLDLSLVSSGYVLLENDKIKEQKLIKSKPDGKRPIDELRRLMKIRDQIKLTENIKLAVIEGISFMSRNTTSIVQLSALNYMVREYLYLHYVPFLIVPPSTLKKFIAENGHAKKDQMMLETYKKFGESFTNNDLCDAFGLAHCGSAVLGNKQYVTTKKQKEVITLLEKQLNN